ncbi:hypothetical protein JHK87_045009 [Glycine soja]|nr:hypothetical protein JHK87_045009 [Glycine soja]
MLSWANFGFLCRVTCELLEKAKSQVNLLKKQNKKLAKVVGGCLGQYYRYHGDWKSETQSVVSMLKFMHWLETRSLLEHKEAKEKLGCTISLNISWEEVIYRAKSAVYEAELKREERERHPINQREKHTLYPVTMKLSYAEQLKNTMKFFSSKNLSSNSLGGEIPPGLAKHLATTVEIVFLIIHGQFGEDADIQELLEKYNVPFVGTGSKESCQAFDKGIDNKLLIEIFLEGGSELATIVLDVGFDSNSFLVVLLLTEISSMEQIGFLFQQASKVGFSHTNILRSIIHHACLRFLNLASVSGISGFQVRVMFLGGETMLTRLNGLCRLPFTVLVVGGDFGVRPWFPVRDFRSSVVEGLCNFMARIPDKIRSIDGSKETLKLAVRITDLWFVGTPNKSEQAEMVFVDSEGDQIHAICKSDHLKSWKADLKENCTYVMHNFKVVKNDGQFRVCEHEYKLFFIGVTVVREADLHELPFKEFRFVEFANVVAGNFVSGLLFLSYLNERGDDGPMVIILTNARIKDAQGSYPALVSNSFKASKLLINDPILEIQEFKERKTDIQIGPFTCGCGKDNDQPDRECAELIGQTAYGVNRVKIEDGDLDLNASPQALDKLLGHVLAFKVRIQSRFKNVVVLKYSKDLDLINVVLEMLPDSEQFLSATVDHDPVEGFPLTPK